MSANILPNTEHFSGSGWTSFDGLVVTADSHAAPGFAGIHAGGADTLEDTSGSITSSLYGDFETIPNDSSAWIASVYIQKDMNESRFLGFVSDIRGGASERSYGLSLNTKTGQLSMYDSPGPTDFGVEDVDSLWWRIWMRPVNNSSGNTAIRVAIFPCMFTSLGSGISGGLTGSVIAWGMNLTNDDTLQIYQPDPTYVFEHLTGTIFRRKLG